MQCNPEFTHFSFIHAFIYSPVLSTYSVPMHGRYVMSMGRFSQIGVCNIITFLLTLKLNKSTTRTHVCTNPRNMSFFPSPEFLSVNTSMNARGQTRAGTQSSLACLLVSAGSVETPIWTSFYRPQHCPGLPPATHTQRAAMTPRRGKEDVLPHPV